MEYNSASGSRLLLNGDLDFVEVPDGYANQDFLEDTDDEDGNQPTQLEDSDEDATGDANDSAEDSANASPSPAPEPELPPPPKKKVVRRVVKKKAT